MRDRIAVDVDHVADVAYVRFSDAQVARTVAHDDAINIDLDTYNVVVGIEILDLRADLPFQALISDYHVDSGQVELLRQLRPSISGFVARFATDGPTLAGSDTPAPCR
jgi:uncharacterized protein YuzE